MDNIFSDFHYMLSEEMSKKGYIPHSYINKMMYFVRVGDKRKLEEIVSIAEKEIYEKQKKNDKIRRLSRDKFLSSIAFSYIPVPTERKSKIINTIGHDRATDKEISSIQFSKRQ